MTQPLLQRVAVGVRRRKGLTGFSRLNDAFRKFSQGTARALGSPWAFVGSVVILMIWAATGPRYHYSDTWQLVVNSGTGLVTYLAVFLIQNTQNRDGKAIHLKLDELLRAVEGARTHLADLQNLTDEELDELERQFRRLRLREIHDAEKAEAQLPPSTPSADPERGAA